MFDVSVPFDYREHVTNFPLTEHPDCPGSLVEYVVGFVTVRFHLDSPLGTFVFTSPDRRYGLPSCFEATSDDPALPAVVSLDVVMKLQPRRPEVDAVRVQRRNGGSVDGDTLRRIPLARVLRSATAAAALNVYRDGDQIKVEPAAIPTPSFVINPDDERWSRDGFSSSLRPRSEPALRWRVDADLLTEVAEVYRSALARGETGATEAVAEHFGKSRSTAGRWVTAARGTDYGGPFLGPAIGPKAGEGRARNRTGEDTQ